MPSLRRIAAYRILAAALAACLVVPAIGLQGGVALAARVSTPAIEAKRLQASRAQAKLDDLADQLEQRYQEYLEATGQLDKVRAEIAANERQLEAATQALETARSKLASRADSIYRTGPTLALEMFVGTDSIQDFLSRWDIMAAIGRSDADLVGDVRDARFQVEQARTKLDEREVELTRLRTKAAQRKAEVDKAFKRQHAYLDSIQGELAQLIKAEQERQARLAAERARIARLAAAARAKAAAAAARKSGGSGGGGSDSLPAPDSSPSQIVQVALEYLGVPYVWGGSSPSGFDCSGLSQYVYARCGVSIPRTSREQFDAGTHIPANDVGALRPGDLVFFGTNGDPGRVHHVGIYCGDGNFIHAPATGDNVKVSSLTGRISSRGDYVGGSRF